MLILKIIIKLRAMQGKNIFDLYNDNRDKTTFTRCTVEKICSHIIFYLLTILNPKIINSNFTQFSVRNSCK